jgi:hypothetical protein
VQGHQQQEQHTIMAMGVPPKQHMTARRRTISSRLRQLLRTQRLILIIKVMAVLFVKIIIFEKEF